MSLPPAREFPTDEGAIRALFRGQYREQFEISRAEGPVYQEVSRGAGPPASNTLPLFFNQTASLFDYLPGNTLLLTVGRSHPRPSALERHRPAL